MEEEDQRSMGLIWGAIGVVFVGLQVRDGMATSGRR